MRSKSPLGVVLIFSSTFLLAQTSWKGTTSTNWSTGSNWTAGVPTATIDAIIGDASFTGGFQPTLTANSACKSLTIGSGSTVSTITIARNLTVSGSITIGSNGTILANTASRVITLSGSWTNSGTYNASVASAQVTFSGAAQTVTGATTFKTVVINNGSTLTLASNITVNTSLSVSGTLDPTASYIVSGTGTMTVNATGIIKIKASTFAGNFSISGAITLSPTSTVNYASAVIDQTISNAYSYGYLRASGGMTKSLSGNLPALSSANANAGRIYVDNGTLDLGIYTANRGTPVAGGAFTMAAATTLKIGGTNTFPANFNTKSIAATSTVEYNGTSQTVVATTYGNLSFSSSSGVAVKTMPATAMTVAGNFTSSAGAGTGVTFTAGNNITVNRDVTLDASTTFDGNSNTHTFKGSWSNSGTFTGSTSTVIFSGTSGVLSGTGTNNFNNLTFSATGITAAATTTLTIAGNLSTTGASNFTHSAGGTLSMTGAAKTFTGTGLRLANCIIGGTITTAANISISGDLTVNGSLAASAGTITLSGTSKTISGSGSVTFFAISVTGTISTANSFTSLSNISVAAAGTFTETAGTVTINGAGCVLSGNADLFNVTINAAKTLRLNTNSALGIAGVFTKTGTLNVTTSVPNTVEYNSSGAQSVVGTSYNNLILANSGTKTAAGVITVNNDFTINSGVTFDASSYVFSLFRHFTNNGSFTASTSDIQFRGAGAANITGATTFNNLTFNKSSALLYITLLSNVSTTNLTMTQGNMSTGTNSITITGTRSGAGTGVIVGTIVQNHAFTNGTTYYFEGPDNKIIFTSPSAGLTSVTVKITLGQIADFDATREAILREYEVTIPAGTYTNATWRMHYQDNELNAFDEPSLSQFKFNSGVTWDSIGFTTKSSATNYVEKTGLTALAGRWTLSGLRNVVRWNGSISSAWGTAGNWTTISGSNMSNRVPTSTDAAQIGQAAFTNNPTITSAQTVNVLRYGSVQSSTLTITSGSLTTIGSIVGQWSASASHTLDASSGTLTVGTNLELSDGTSGHDILLQIGSGSATVNYDVTQSATGGVNFTGTGTLTIGKHYNYTAGSFTGGSGTVVYTGSEAQTVAPVTYNNLSFTKSSERATISSALSVNGNLTTATGGELEALSTLTVAGNITIGASTNFLESGVTINVGGNWTNNGTFTVGSGTVNFNGSGSQSVNANIFSTITINKSAGTLSLTGDLVLNNNLTLTSGTLDLSTFTMDRSGPGGILALAAGSSLKIAGAANFPGNYITNTINSASTVEYNGTVAQNVADVDYGNLTFTGGGATPKTLVGDIQVNGDLLVNSGATLDPATYNLTLNGNFTHNGTFTPSSSTLILIGSSKTISGSSALTVNNLSAVAGTYTVSNTTISIVGNIFVDVPPSSVSFGTGIITLDGDLTNKGSLTSSGTLNISGTRLQTLSLIGALISASTGVVNFNGTVLPISNSTSPPSFYTVNVNNTGGVWAPVQPWTVVKACNIAAGVVVDFGAITHTFYGDFTNNGTVLSSGKLKFTPILAGPPFPASATITLDAAGGGFTSTGEVEFAGSAPITVVSSAPTLNNITVTSVNAAGITPPASWTIGGDLLIGPGATFKGGAGLSHTFVGDITNNGTLSGGTSTITFTGTPASMNGTGSTNFNNLTIGAGADVTLNKSIGINGNLVNNGTFTTIGRSVNFTGIGASTISGSSPITLDDMEQNKSGAATTLSVPVTLTGDLTLTDGIINTTATNILTLNDNATSTAGTSTSYISGPMKKIGDDAFVFPLGKGAVWARLGISAPASSTAEFQAEYNASSYSITTGMIAPLDHVSKGEHWILGRNVSADNVAVTLFWEDGTRSGINDLSDIVVAHYNGTNWINETQNGGTTGSASAGTVTSQLVTSFSPFTFGSKTSGSSVNPLPVELIDFSAQADNNFVNLFWTTASENNSDQFIVQRSLDGNDFEDVKRLKAAGNSHQVINYSTSDPDPYSGISYYRLKQADLGGQIFYSKIIQVEFVPGKAEFISVYPNPVVDQINVALQGTPGDEVLLVLRDIFGREYYSKVVLLSVGQEVIAFSPATKLATGVYTIVATSKGDIYRKKIVIR